MLVLKKVFVLMEGETYQEEIGGIFEYRYFPVGFTCIEKDAKKWAKKQKTRYYEELSETLV
jgi:hypothetical protein